MRRRLDSRWVIVLGSVVSFAGLASPARAAIPAGYKGTPFDPAVAGGAGIVPATVTAGPYAVPGRIEFVNYDMGGDGVGYHTDAHYTTKDGDGYRSDRPSATMSKTGPSKPDLFYGTGTAQDGAPYPNATDADFYVGSVHPGDWFNYTIDVKTTGTYTLSSVFATGNGPPGGEGGDGQMELLISVDGTQVADWKTVFPDFADKANFHNWKPYPSFATLTLEAGAHVLKFQAPFKHLNLDVVDLELVGADGGASPVADAGPAAGDASTGTAGAGGTSGAAGTTGAGGTTGAAGDGAAGDSGSAAAGASGAAGTTGGAGTGATGAAGTGAKAPGTTKSGGCALATAPAGGSLVGVALGFALLVTACASRGGGGAGRRRSRR